MWSASNRLLRRFCRSMDISQQADSLQGDIVQCVSFTYFGLLVFEIVLSLVHLTLNLLAPTTVALVLTLRLLMSYIYMTLVT